MDFLLRMMPEWISPQQVKNTTDTFIKRVSQPKTERKKLNKKQEMDLYARMARQAYQVNRQEKVRGYELVPDESTTKRAVYFNPKTNHYIVAQRGTKKTDVEDIKDDYDILHNRLDQSPRHRKELEWLKKFKEGKDVTLTGHSLGSNHSKLLAIETGLPMVGFSEGSTPTLQNLATNAFTSNDNIKNYKVGYDPLSISNPFSESVTPKKEWASNPHALDHFIETDLENIEDLEDLETLKE